MASLFFIYLFIVVGVGVFLFILSVNVYKFKIMNIRLYNDMQLFKKRCISNFGTLKNLSLTLIVLRARQCFVAILYVKK